MDILVNKHRRRQESLKIVKIETVNTYGTVKRNFFLSPQSQFRNLKEALPQSQFRNF
jgi:hypothetical protein